MSQRNKKITKGKLPTTNNTVLVRTCSLIRPALFQEIPAAKYKIFVRTGTGTRDNSKSQGFLKFLLFIYLFIYLFTI